MSNVRRGDEKIKLGEVVVLLLQEGYKLILHHSLTTLIPLYSFNSNLGSLSSPGGGGGPTLPAIHYRESLQPIRACQVAHTTVAYYTHYRHTVVVYNYCILSFYRQTYCHSILPLHTTLTTGILSQHTTIAYYHCILSYKRHTTIAYYHMHHGHTFILLYHTITLHASSTGCVQCSSVMSMTNICTVIRRGIYL